MVNNFEVNNFLGSKKSFWSKKFWGQKILGSKKFWGQKKFWVQKKIGVKVQQFFLGQKIFGQKDLSLKISLSKKMQVGLTQGGGFMTPPPHPENSRVKIVLGCC